MYNGMYNDFCLWQVLLMLTSDLDSDEEKDKGALDALLTAIIKELDLAGKVCLNINNILILILKFPKEK